MPADLLRQELPALCLCIHRRARDPLPTCLRERGRANGCRAARRRAYRRAQHASAAPLDVYNSNGLIREEAFDYEARFEVFQEAMEIALIEIE